VSDNGDVLLCDPEHAYTLPGSIRLIAGEYFEPLEGINCCVIEQVEFEVDSQQVANELRSWVSSQFPEARRLMLRSSDLDLELPGFVDHVYYIRLAREPEPGASSELMVRPAQGEDTTLIQSWLVRAFDDALGVTGGSPDRDAAQAQASLITQDPSTRSLVVCDASHAFGHVTLLPHAEDDLTGSTFVELLDLLVEPTDSRRREAERLLVHAASQIAKELDRPLVGHIVCLPDCAGSRRLLSRLESAGWAFTYKYLRSDLESE